MANGSFSNGSGQNCKLVINWSSSKGDNGSTVSATLIAQNQNNWYFDAVVYGYGITINGNQHTGSGARLSGSINGSAGLISHSVWVSYTNDKTINISGYANFNGIINLSNQSISGNATLDRVGWPPSMGSVTAPSNGIISETSTSITVSWNGGSSYNNAGNYRVEVSVNGGGWTSIATGLSWSTRSYTYSLPNRSQGTSYRFRVDCSNNVGWSAYQYSGTATLNAISAPTINNIGTYNPYTNSTLTVGLSGGSQSNGGNLVRMCDLYYGGTWLATARSYEATPWWNTTQTITYAAASYAARIGTGAYSSDSFRIVAWCENSNRSRSGYVEKYFTVNINTDGGAVPSMGDFTLSGGAFSHPSTCFISGISKLTVIAANASLNRAPNGTSITYTTSITGVSSKNGKQVEFGSLSAGRKTITVTATDSRGLSRSVSRDIQFQSYSAPTIRNFTVQRLDNPQTSARLSYTLSYSPIYDYSKGADNKGSQLNNISAQQYSTDNANWMTATNGGNVTGLSTEKIYTLRLRVLDKANAGTYTIAAYTVPTIFTNVAIRKQGVGINCVPQSEFALDISGNSRISGSLQASGNFYTTSKGVAIGKAVEKSAFEVNMDGYFYKNIYGQKITSGEVMHYGGSIDGFDGSSLWVKLGTWTSYADSNSCKITVLTGDGFNAYASQNTEIEIFIKDSWQSSTSTTGAFGASFIVKYNYNYLISVWVMAQSHNQCDVWVRLPYSYGNGTYLFEGRGQWAHSNETRPFDSSPTTGVRQECNEMTADYKGYPVGSIYITWDNTNPQSFMGGTWVRMAEGRGLFGIGTSKGRNGISGTVEVHEKFGDWKHTITADEMPNHSHNIAHFQSYNEAKGYGLHTGSVGFSDRVIIQGDYNNSKRYSTTSSTGSGTPFYTVSPYIGVYVWRRTA